MSLSSPAPHAPVLDRAFPADAQALQRLLKEAFRDYVRRVGREESGPHDWLEPAIAAGQVRCAREAGMPVAIVVTTADPEARTLTIDTLAVDPSRAGRGLGSQLLREVETAARRNGFETIKLHTLAVLTHLVALYSRHGFVVTRVGPPPHCHDDHPRVYMAKAIT